MTAELAIAVPEIRRANKAQAAEFFDISLPTLESWMRKGAPVIQRGSRGISWILDLNAVARWHYEGRAEMGEIDPDAMSPADRKAWYEGESKKRDLQIRDRELIPVAEVERTISVAFAAIAQDIRAIPDNLERRHGVSQDVAVSVESALYEALDALAERLATLASVGGEE